MAVPLEQLAELPSADRSPRTGAGVVEEEDVHDPCPYPHRDPPTPRHPVTCTAVWGAARRGRCRGRSATEDRMRALITNDDGIDATGLRTLAAAAVGAGYEVVVLGMEADLTI